MMQPCYDNVMLTANTILGYFSFIGLNLVPVIITVFMIRNRAQYTNPDPKFA
jgi:hypothetical protein